MAGIIFIIVQACVLLLLSSCVPAQAATGTETTGGVNIALSEIITILSFIGGLFGVWLDVRLRIKSLEIKTRQNETNIKNNKEESGDDICELKELIKDNAELTQKQIAKLTESLNDWKVVMAEKIGTLKK